MKTSTRVWVLFMVGVLLTASGLGSVWVTASDRMAEAASTLVLADGVDPTLPAVLDLRSGRLSDTIRTGLVPGAVRVDPYKGEDISQMNAYTDAEERILIRAESGGIYWAFERRPYFEPSALLLMAGLGVLIASGMFAATRYSVWRGSRPTGV